MPKFTMWLSGRRPSWNKKGPKRYLIFEEAGGPEALVVGVTKYQYEWLKARWPYPVEEAEGEA